MYLLVDYNAIIKLTSNLFMNNRNKLLISILLGALVITGCNSSGFGVVHHAATEDDTPLDNSRRDDATPISSGGSGNNYGDDRGHSGNDDKKDTGAGEVIAERPEVDISSKLQTFNFVFYETIDENYVYVTFVSDPLDEKYNYAYYTVNDDKIEPSLTKVTVNGEQVYKIYLGTTKVGNYSIKFYNDDSLQYGFANISIVEKNPITHNSFLSVMISIVQIKTIAFGYAVAEGFRKIGDFFSSLFSREKASNISFGNGS